MLQQNVNEYDQYSFKNSFSQTEIYSKIEKESDIILWEKFFVGWNSIPRREMTIREHNFSRIVTVTSFYYLNYLLEKNPPRIIDIGCGSNWFKRFIPCIWGIDGLRMASKYFRADQQVLYNDQWVKSKKKAFPSIMTICSLHFRPLENIREAIINIMDMVQPGGRGYIAFNVARLLDKTAMEDFMIFKNTANFANNIFSSISKSTDGDPEPAPSSIVECKKTLADVEQYIRRELYDLPAYIHVFDLDLTYIEDGVDGNLRIEFEK